MKNATILFWLLIIIGTLALIASIISYTKGEDFTTYFWGGFCGITLIGTALIREKNNKA